MGTSHGRQTGRKLFELNKKLDDTITFEDWTDFPYAETSDPEELTQRQLEEERWNAGSEQTDEIRH